MSLEFKEIDKDADVSKHGPLPVIQGANKDFRLDRLETHGREVKASVWERTGEVYLVKPLAIRKWRRA